MNKIKVRKHRGGFKESCETMKEIDCEGRTVEEIRKAVFDYFIEQYPDYKKFWPKKLASPDGLYLYSEQQYYSEEGWNDELIPVGIIGMGVVGFINKRVL